MRMGEPLTGFLPGLQCSCLVWHLICIRLDKCSKCSSSLKSIHAQLLRSHIPIYIGLLPSSGLLFVPIVCSFCNPMNDPPSSWAHFPAFQSYPLFAVIIFVYLPVHLQKCLVASLELITSIEFCPYCLYLSTRKGLHTIPIATRFCRHCCDGFHSEEKLFLTRDNRIDPFTSAFI